MAIAVARAGRTEIVYRILLVLGSLVFTFAILEFLAWIEVFDYRAVIGVPVGGLHDVFDRELLHRHGPHLHLAGSSRGGQITGPFQIPPSERQLYQWDVHYDQNGFRNQTDLTKADIAVIGDSFVEGMTIPDD